MEQGAWEHNIFRSLKALITHFSHSLYSLSMSIERRSISMGHGHR